jgi:transcriptional regulator with XRE-family HTH domain
MGSFGENLRRERELRGIDLRDIAEATKISVRFLQALEQDRVDVLPGGIFPRAFVRQYARYLGLDPERLVAEFLYATGAEARPQAPRDRARRGRGLLWPAAGVALVLVAAAAIGGNVVGRVRGAWAERSRREEPSPPATATVPFPEDRVYPPPSPPPRAAEGDGLRVDLEARQDSWVGVQVDGLKVIDRVLKQGEKQAIEAKREIVLSVGNAGGVGLTVNGQPAPPLGHTGEVRRNVVITRDNLAELMRGTAAASRPAGLRPPSARPASSPSPRAAPSPSPS